MLNNVSLSRYIYGKSIFHQMNTFGKILGLLLLLGISIISNNLYIHFLIIIYILISIIFTEISLKYYIHSVFSLKYLLVGIFLINYFMGVDNIINAINILKIIEIVLYTTIVLLTTNELELISGLNTLFKPLQIFNIKINKLSFILFLSIQFIPNVIDQVNRIMKILASRGIEFKKNKHKLLLVKSIIIPTINLSLQRADRYAESLEVRFYDINSSKKSFKENKWTIYNTLFIIVLLLIILKEVI